MLKTVRQLVTAALTPGSYVGPTQVAAAASQTDAEYWANLEKLIHGRY